MEEISAVEKQYCKWNNQKDGNWGLNWKPEENTWKSSLIGPNAINKTKVDRLRNGKGNPKEAVQNIIRESGREWIVGNMHSSGKQFDGNWGLNWKSEETTLKSVLMVAKIVSAKFNWEKKKVIKISV